MNIAIAQRIYAPFGGENCNPLHYSFRESLAPYRKLTEPIFDATRLPVGVGMFFAGIGAILLISTVQALMLTLNVLHFIFTFGGKGARESLGATTHDLSVGLSRSSLLVLAGMANFVASPIGIIIFMPLRGFNAIDAYYDQKKLKAEQKLQEEAAQLRAQEKALEMHDRELISYVNTSGLRTQPQLIKALNLLTASQFVHVLDRFKSDGKLVDKMNQHDPTNGYTVLHYIVSQGDEYLALVLLNRGADFNIRSFATEEHQGLTAKELAEKTPEAHNIAQWMEVIERSQPKVEKEIQLKSEVIEINSLDDAVNSVRSLTNLINFLKQNKDADLNQLNEKGLAPIHVAATRGDFAVASELLQRGANVNVETSEGRTGLDLVKVLPGSGRKRALSDLLKNAGGQYSIDKEQVKEKEGSNEKEKHKEQKDLNNQMGVGGSESNEKTDAQLSKLKKANVLEGASEFLKGASVFKEQERKQRRYSTEPSATNLKSTNPFDTPENKLKRLSKQPSQENSTHLPALKPGTPPAVRKLC